MAASGLVQDKATFLAALAAGPATVLGTTLTERSARIYGPIGVIHGVATFDAANGIGKKARAIPRSTGSIAGMEDDQLAEQRHSLRPRPGRSQS